MFHPDEYIASLIRLLKAEWQDRLVYVGLQGSYLRGEATETSDLDIMVVVRGMTSDDLEIYRRAIASLDGYEQSCGFICGTEELQHWNPLEIAHLLHTTRDYFGTLRELVPSYTMDDVRSYVKVSLGNLYHELSHRYIHASRERNREALPGTYKAVFFILQNLHYLRSGQFIITKKEMLQALDGPDKLVLQTALDLQKTSDYDFDWVFSLLFSWCQKQLIAE